MQKFKSYCNSSVQQNFADFYIIRRLPLPLYLYFYIDYSAMVTSTSYSMLVHYSVFNISFYHFHFIAKPHVLSSFDQIATWLRNNIIYISLYQTLSVKFNVEIRDEKEELKFSRWSFETFPRKLVSSLNFSLMFVSLQSVSICNTS